MSADRSHLARNDAERARLEALVARLSDADLGRAMPAGWTVAALLAHVAFWDQRIAALIERWKMQPLVAPRPADEADTDWINDAAKPLFLALPPRRAAETAVAIARAVDGAVAGLSDDEVARNARAGSPLNLDRAAHRRAHLDEIERFLAS
jgi:hypothetical protein